MNTLTKTGNEKLAFALKLLKDYECQDKFRQDEAGTVLSIAEALGVEGEYARVLTETPLMKITPKHRMA